MKFAIKTLREIGILTIALTAALVVNYVYGYDYGVWNDPACGPTGCNTALPINEGGAEQIKNGALDLNLLKITSQSPRIYLQDLTGGHRDADIVVNNNQIFFRLDTNNNPATPNWQNSLVLSNNPSSTKFALFPSQVRASQYCDTAGNNCFTATGTPSGGGSSISITDAYRQAGRSVPPPPSGLAKWPDFIVCDDGPATRAFTVVLSEIRDGGQVIYDVPYADAVIRKAFNSDGTHYTNSVVRSDCGSAANDIRSICQDNRCGSFGTQMLSVSGQTRSFTNRNDIINEFLSISLSNGVNWCALGMCGDALHSSAVGRNDFCNMVLPGSSPISYTQWAFASPSNNDIIYWDIPSGGWVYANPATAFNTVLDSITCYRP